MISSDFDPVKVSKGQGIVSTQQLSWPPLKAFELTIHWLYLFVLPCRLAFEMNGEHWFKWWKWWKKTGHWVRLPPSGFEALCLSKTWPSWPHAWHQKIEKTYNYSKTQNLSAPKIFGVQSENIVFFQTWKICNLRKLQVCNIIQETCVGQTLGMKGCCCLKHGISSSLHFEVGWRLLRATSCFFASSFNLTLYPIGQFGFIAIIP